MSHPRNKPFHPDSAGWSGVSPRRHWIDVSTIGCNFLLEEGETLEGDVNRVVKRVSLRRLRGLLLNMKVNSFGQNVSSWKKALFLEILSDFYKSIARTTICHSQFFMEITAT